jgi:hypothetical protein
MCTYFTGKQNLTFFLSHKDKYLILIVLLMLNSNMYLVFLHHPQFFCEIQVKCAVLERHNLRVPSAMNRRLSHSLPASEHIN